MTLITIIDRILFERRVIKILSIYLSMVETEQEKALIEQIYNKYRRHLKSIALRILGNEHDAEDAVSNTFCLIIEHIDKIEDVDSPKTKAYIFKNIKYAAFNILKKKKRMQNENIDDYSVMVDEQIAFGDVYLDLLYEQVMSLPPVCKDIVMYKTYFGYSNKEIAKLMKLSEKTIGKWLKYSRNVIREIEKESTNV